MIEGGGLGIFRPEEIGPMDVQVPNGVVDILVADETEAAQLPASTRPTSRAAWGLAVRGPAPAARSHSREPASRL